MGVTRVRVVAEIGLTIALAAVLQLIAVWQLPQGGSYSLTMAPLFILALLRGPAAGLTAGGLYGIIDYIINPFPPLHPAQWALDYPVAYGLVGLAGLFSSAWRGASAGSSVRALWVGIVPGILLGALGRYASHVLSGVVFFSAYAVEAGQAPLIYSLTYNSFVLVSATVCAVVAAAVMPQLYRVFVRQAG